MVSSSSRSQSEAQAPLTRAGRVAGFAWLALSGGVLVDGAIWCGQAIAGELRGLDFLSFYATSKLVLSRGPAAMYDLGAQQAIQSRLAAAWGGQPFLPDLYPPFFVVARAWLALLPVQGAYAVWLALHVAVLVAALLLLTAAAGLSGRRRAAALLAGAGFVPAVVDLWQGQQTAFVLLAIAGGTYLGRTRIRASAGAALAGTLIEPHLALLNLLLPLSRPARREALGLVGVALLLAAISLALVGQGGAVHYLQVLPGYAGSAGATMSRYALGLRGLLAAGGLSDRAQYGVLGAGLLTALLLIRLIPGPGRRDVAAATTASLLLAPHLNVHGLELLVAPGILLAGELWRRPDTAGWLVLGIAMAGATLGAYLPLAAVAGELVLLGYLLLGWRTQSV